jgi:midasin (ATPase involved in ribosome maturation)
MARCVSREQQITLRQSLTRLQLPVFIMLDKCVAGPDGSVQPEILSKKSVTFQNGKPVISASIDSFPFPFYLIVTDLNQLPQRLADALRQWFEAGRANL